MATPNPSGFTAADVAAWMFQEAQKSHRLYQETAVMRIRKQFGDEFSYRNTNGNYAIGKDVLKEFKKLSEDTLIWERGERAWRPRKPHDKPGRQQE
jgi:hypothetical protein